MGFPHPDYLLPLLSARQYADWCRYDSQFGVCLDREDIYHAMALSMMYNVHRESGELPMRATEFLVWNLPEDDITQEDFVNKIRGLLPCR